MTALFKFTHLFSGTPGLCAVWAFPSYGEWGCSLVVVHRLSCPVACGILVPGPGKDFPGKNTNKVEIKY